MAKTKLADYEAKRDFTRTDEPSGKVKIRKAEYPRFVIRLPTVFTGKNSSSVTR